eukprot:9461916-Lingulodinium_polyedra.AAC.1
MSRRFWRPIRRTAARRAAKPHQMAWPPYPGTNASPRAVSVRRKVHPRVRRLGIRRGERPGRP